jgi:hypothetical protein
MMKRILLALALVVLPSLAMAGTADRDILLTSDGTLYTVESAFSEQLGLDTKSPQVLVLNIRDEKSTTTTYVPETLLGGSHTNPALAYDALSKTLFVFWQRAINNGMSSDLVFCSYQNGKWSEAVSIDSANYHYSHNTRIGVTRKVDQIDENGAHTSVPELTVHAVWWEESGHTEWARYAMLTIDNGMVSDIQIRDLSAFVDVARDFAGPRAADFNTEILRHPALFESASHDTVDVVFGDLNTNNMHRVTIKPTLDLGHIASEGRLRVPIGVKDAGMGAPNFRTGANAVISALPGSGDKLVFYSDTGNALNYVTYGDGAWSPMRSLPLTEKVSTETGVEALRKMVNAE